jgi:acyl dehydratase
LYGDQRDQSHPYRPGSGQTGALRQIDRAPIIRRDVPQRPAFLSAGKDVEFLAPIHPGDAITLSSHVKEIYEKTGRTGSMAFVIVRTTLKNQNGEEVAHIDHRFMNRI